MELKTEYEFILPRGYVDKDGQLHREGVMRLANAKDEIVPLNDMRVQRNRAYLITKRDKLGHLLDRKSVV